MGTTFKAQKEVTNDYYPPGVQQSQHTPGLDCHCNPYEEWIHSVWTKNEHKARVALLVKVTITHRKLHALQDIPPDIQMPSFGDDKIPVGTDDLVTTLKKAHNRVQQLVREQ